MILDRSYLRTRSWKALMESCVDKQALSTGRVHLACCGGEPVGVWSYLSISADEQVRSGILEGGIPEFFRKQARSSQETS